MRKLGILCIVAGLLLIGGSAALHWKTQALVEVPPAVLALERSLARPGLLALATLNVASLVDLGVVADAEDDGLARELRDAGIDVRTDVTHATLSLRADPEGDARAAIALFGRFDPARIEAALRARDDVEVESDEIAGRPVIRLVRIDRDTCDPSGPFALHLTAERLLAAEPDDLAALLGDASPAPGPLRDLTGFQRFRSGQLVSAAFFVPDTLPATGNPFVGMAALGAKQQVDGFRALYAGAAPRVVPPGVSIDALLEGTRPGLAAEKAAAWTGWLDARLAGVRERVPTLATLHDALSLRAEGDDLVARFQLSRTDIERLRELPGELSALVFGRSASFALSGAEPPSEDRLDDDPQVFLPEASKADLRPYDPGATLAAPVDRKVGPLGVRLAAIRLGEDGGPAEIEVEAFATAIPNLGDGTDRVSLAITGIEGPDGEALLAEEHCGPERNALPAVFSNHFGGELLQASKAVRLREGAAPDDVARIVGTATLRLPTRTETLKLSGPGAVERGGARLVVGSVEGGTVSYEVTGAVSSLLHVRGLNAAGRPLAESSASSMSGFGSGRSTSQDFAGNVAAIEAVFATEEQTLAFPFALEGGRPGSDGEILASDPASDAGEAVAITGAFEDWLARTVGNVSQAALQVAGAGEGSAPIRTGPFSVRLEGLWPFGGLMPQIEVRAPEIPGVEGSVSAVELRLSELQRSDGETVRGPWSEPLAMREAFGSEGLVATSQIQTGLRIRPEQVASLHGAVHIRLPSRVRSERIDAADLGAGIDTDLVSVRLVELGRDRFVLRADRGAERVLGARAFNEEGEPLWTSHEDAETTAGGSRALSFRVNGVPRRIDVRVALDLAEAAYPFVLQNGERQVARAR